MHYTGDISLYSIDSTNLLSFFQNVTLRVQETTLDASSLKATGTRAEGVKMAGTITTSLRSTSSTTSDSVSHYDAGSLTFGGRTFTCYASAGIEVSYKKYLRKCVGAKYKNEVNTKLELKGEFEITAEDGDAEALLTPFDAGAAYTAKNAVWTLSLNGTTITIPVRLTQVELVGEGDDGQVLRVSWDGRAPNSGAYPTAPTGTSGLFQKALNAFKTPIAFTFQSIAGTVGVAASGNLFFDTVSLKIEDEQLIPIQYSFRNAGDWNFDGGTA